MRKTIFILAVLLASRIFSIPNPLPPPPCISEFYYNGGDWQLEVYFWDIYENFDDLRLVCNAGVADFIPGITIQTHTAMIIDESSLLTPLLVNPYVDEIFFEEYFGGQWYELEGSIKYGSGTSTPTAPGPGQSIAFQFFYDMYSSEYRLLKESPPTMGSNPHQTNTRCSFRGYVYDQNNNPVEGIKFQYCDESYCDGYMSPSYACFETDENGYFETDGLFSAWHNFKLEQYGVYYAYDQMFFEPDSVYYKEYTITSTGIAEVKEPHDINISAAPNPFVQKTNFHISMPDNQRWKNGKITIRSINGQLVDVIEFPNASWSDNTFSITWYPAMARADIFPGLYIYSLEIDGRFVASEKIIIQD